MDKCDLCGNSCKHKEALKNTEENHRNLLMKMEIILTQAYQFTVCNVAICSKKRRSLRNIFEKFMRILQYFTVNNVRILSNTRRPWRTIFYQQEFINIGRNLVWDIIQTKGGLLETCTKCSWWMWDLSQTKGEFLKHRHKSHEW